MLTLALDRPVSSHYNFNYANNKTAWEAIIMILNETRIIHIVHILSTQLRFQSHAVEKKDRKYCLRVTANAYTAPTMPGSTLKSLCVLAG